MSPKIVSTISVVPPAASTRNLSVMVVDDEALIRGPLALYLESKGHKVIEAASTDDAVRLSGATLVDVTFLDIRLGTSNGLDAISRLLASNPRMKIIMITAYGTVDAAVCAMSRGAADFLCKPFTPNQVAAILARVTDLRILENEVGVLTDRAGTGGPDADFATTSKQLQESLALARKVAPTPIPVLIRGERGTGKRVLAHAIHGWGACPERALLSCDCSARSAAFTDVAIFGDSLVDNQVVEGDQPSLLKQANGGALLLTHVDMLSERSRARLVHLINHREVESYTGQTTPCNVRIIATVSDPSRAPRRDQFQTLIERISISLPPLRERVQDIPALAQRYLAQARQLAGKKILGFSEEAMDLLQNFPWPGNLSELYAVTQESVAAADTLFVTARHLPAAIQNAAPGTHRKVRAGDPVTLSDMEAAHIREVLAASHSLPEAAGKLGIDLQALYRRRKAYNL